MLELQKYSKKSSTPPANGRIFVSKTPLVVFGTEESIFP